MNIIPDNFIIERSESKVYPKTKICDEEYHVILKLNKSFTDPQIREVVNFINIYYTRGFEEGKEAVQQEIREALGIFVMGENRVDIGDAEIDVSDYS